MWLRGKLSNVLAEQQYGCVLQFATSSKEAKIVQYIFSGCVRLFFVHSPGSDAALEEVVDGFSVNVIDGGPEDRYIIPGLSHLLHNELLKGRSLQFLLG